MFRRAFCALVLTASVGAMFTTPSVASADPVGGSIVKSYTVEARSTDTLTVTLRGGETTRIRLSGDGDTCLELRVYDENGNLVASDTVGLGDDREVFVRPKWTGKFSIKVANLGTVYNRYVIALD